MTGSEKRGDRVTGRPRAEVRRRAVKRYGSRLPVSGKEPLRKDLHERARDQERRNPEVRDDSRR